MPCHAAMNDKPDYIDEDQSVEIALALMAKKGISHVAVVDDERILQGVFSYRELYKNLLPVSIPVAGAGHVSMKINAPGVAKRLHKVSGLPVRDFMNRKPVVVHPDTPTWQGTNLFVETGEPIFVIDSASGKLIGVVDGHTIMKELHRLSGA